MNPEQFFTAMGEEAARRMGQLLSRKELPKYWQQRVRKLLDFVEACGKAATLFTELEYDQFGEIAYDVLAARPERLEAKEKVPQRKGLLTETERHILEEKFSGNDQPIGALVREIRQQLGLSYVPHTLGAVLGTLTRKFKVHKQELLKELSPQLAGKIVDLTDLDSQRLGDILRGPALPPS